MKSSMQYVPALIACCTVVLLCACARTPGSNVQDSLAQKGITSFEECVAAGYAVRKTFPGQCMTPDGRVFVQGRSAQGNDSSDAICVDKCGDGMCQEIVCMAQGCPCAESKESCPADCR